MKKIRNRNKLEERNNKKVLERENKEIEKD